jgi:hypothetical protein
MSLERPNLKIENTINDQCTGFTLADTTGEYPTATTGYGAPDTIIHDDVTGLIVTVRNLSTGIYFTYTFTLLFQVTQTCTLSLQGGTPADIQTEVGPLAFPFIQDVNEFNPWADYGITLPDFVDGVYQVEYEITGSSSITGVPVEFDYTTSETFLVDCETACCISKMYAKLDSDCSCSDKASELANQAYTFLMIARGAAEIGDNDKAVDNLKKAADLCNCQCKSC